MHWIIEELNYANDFNSAQRLMYILAERGIPYTSFKYVPFGGTDYSFLPNSPAVFYGGYNSLMDMRERVENLPTPLAWCDLDKFKCSTYYKELAPFIFQQDHEFFELKDMPKLLSRRTEDKLFFRPDDNEKSFTGQVVERYFWQSFPKQMIEYRYLAEDLLCLCSPAKQIDYEWRLLIVNEKIITGSQYREGRTIDIVGGYPVECGRFAEQVAKHWSPHPVYMLDVCQSEGQYSVMEIGPFNYAGMYLCDLEKVVEAINGL